MQTTDFYFDLPEKYIANTPAEPRDSSKLMVIHKKTKTIEHRIFRDLPEILPKNTLMIRNNSKVMRSRIIGNFETGSRFELFFIEQKDDSSGVFLVFPGRKFKKGETKILPCKNGNILVTVQEILPGGERILTFLKPITSILANNADVALPPYIEHEDPNSMEPQYQTTFAKHEGSIAAPTAGLHFTKEVDKALTKKGIVTKELTLHVGLGTFLPVKVDDIQSHHMHRESFEVHKDVLETIDTYKNQHYPILTVGTTTTRVLEHIYGNKHKYLPYAEITKDSTDIFIYPSYTWKCTDMLLTNFHLPKSTLIMLVSSMIGNREFTLHAYEEAKKHKYRFYSFGDAMLILD